MNYGRVNHKTKVFHESFYSYQHRHSPWLIARDGVRGLLNINISPGCTGVVVHERYLAEALSTAVGLSNLHFVRAAQGQHQASQRALLKDGILSRLVLCKGNQSKSNGGQLLERGW